MLRPPCRPRCRMAAHAKRKYRPDLSDYLPYIDALVDRLNEDGAYKMNRTDAVKIAVEQAVAKVLQQVVVNKKRKQYVRIPF